MYPSNPIPSMAASQHGDESDIMRFSLLSSLRGISIYDTTLPLNLGFQSLRCSSGTVIHPHRERKSFRASVKDEEIKITCSFSPLRTWSPFPSFPARLGSSQRTSSHVCVQETAAVAHLSVFVDTLIHTHTMRMYINTLSESLSRASFQQRPPLNIADSTARISFIKINAHLLKGSSQEAKGSSEVRKNSILSPS